MNPHQKRARNQERDVAAQLGGRTTAGSGNTLAHGNDVITKRLSVECKTTSAGSYRLSLDTLQAAERNALLDGREMVLLVEIHGRTYAVVSRDFLYELLGVEA